MGTLKSTNYKDPPKVLVEDARCQLIGMLTNGVYNKMHDIGRRVYNTNGISPTIHTMGGGNLEPKILEPVSGQFRPKDRNYNLHNTDRNEQFETRSDLISNAILTNAIKNCILEPTIIQKVGDRGTSKYSSHDYANTIPANAMSDRGQLLVEPNGDMLLPGNNFNQNKRVHSEDGITQTIIGSGHAGNEPKVYNTNFRVRKLTPLECWRLMGFSDEDFHKAKAALNKQFHNGADRSNSQLYKQAGNSIVVPVIEYLVDKMIGEPTL